MIPITDSRVYRHACRVVVLFICLLLTACVVCATRQETPAPTVDSLPSPSIVPTDVPPTATVATPSPIPPVVSTPFPGTVIASPPTAIDAPEALVLKQVSGLVSMCPPDFGSNGLFIFADESPARFRLACGVGWGHVADVEIWRYGSLAAAQSAFADILGDLSVQDFYGYPALEWRCFAVSYANCEPSGGVERGMLHRNHCWQADRWLICAHAFDDTGIKIAADPLEISEVTHQAFVEHGLLSQDR